jgi:hypothetical protein
MRSGQGATSIVLASVVTAFLVLVLAGAETQRPVPQKPKPAEPAGKPDDARLDEILRLNREILTQHQAYRQVNEEKVRRLVDLLDEYQRRWATDRFSDEMRRAQERADRYAAESEHSMRVGSLESQLRRLEQQVREMESKVQQYQQMLDAKQREIQQLEDRLRMQSAR